MSLLWQVLVGGYFLLWWLVFWLPIRKPAGSPFAFIPAMICSFSIPLMSAYFFEGHPFSPFIRILWVLIPITILVLKLVLRFRFHRTAGRGRE